LLIKRPITQEDFFHLLKHLRWATAHLAERGGIESSFVALKKTNRSILTFKTKTTINTIINNSLGFTSIGFIRTK